MKQKDKWEDYVYTNLKQLVFEGIIREGNVAQYSVHQQTLMKTVNYMVTQNESNFLNTEMFCCYVIFSTLKNE